MTSTEIDQQGPALAPALLGGAGMTPAGRAEVARAIAEVMAKVQLARAFPRSYKTADARVSVSCRRWSFAKAAFYAYPRGNRWDSDLNAWVPNIITGPSIRLAEELGTAWQNLEWDVVELDRDPERNISTVRAFCRDNELNVEAGITWIVPLVLDKWEGPKGKRVKVKEALTDERDRYERVANEGSRRVRAKIFNLLPAWYIDDAIELCNETLAKGPDGDQTPEPVRMVAAVDRFAATFSIRQEQLERFVGASFERWRTHDLARLIVLYETLVRGELRLDEVFPTDSPATAEDAPGPAKPAENPPLMANTRITLDDLLKQAGLGGRANTQRKFRVAGALAGEELDIPPVPVRQWKDLDNNQAIAAQAGVRKLITMDEADRAARIEELDAMGQQALQVPEDGKRDAEPPALDRLRQRFTDAGRGDPELHGDLMRAVTSVLVHGHWEELASLDDLTQQEAEYALGRIDGIFRDARSKDHDLGERVDLMYQSAQQQRAAAEARDDQDDDPGPDAPGE